MAKVRIVTDSASELPADLVEELGITVLPLTIRLRDQIFADGPEYCTPSFHERVFASRTLPTVSAPPVSAYQRTYVELASEAEDIISIHTSTLPTNTVEPATEAARAVIGQVRVHVVDCAFMSRAMGYIVEEGARAAFRGATGPEIVRLVRALVPLTYLAFFVDNLTYLRRSGALRPAALSPGSLNVRIGTKPILLMEEGFIVPQLRVRNKGSAVERLVDFIGEILAIKRLTVIHSGLMPEIDELLAQMAERLHLEDVPTAIYGPATAAAIGPKALGVAIMEQG